jgi:uncharacterized protein YneF (UPF0154 family)
MNNINLIMAHLLLISIFLNFFLTLGIYLINKTKKRIDDINSKL